MTKEVYLKVRNEMMLDAENLVTEGKTVEANKKMEEIKTMDANFEAHAQAQANINAMKESTPIAIENMSVGTVTGTKVGATTEAVVIDSVKAYENAWAKSMMNKKLDPKEQELFNARNIEFQNAYTHDTGNTTVLIPETVVAGIWKRMGESFPLLGDVRKFSVTGTLTIKKHTTLNAGDAAFYAEGTDTADEQNTFGEVSLSGCELAKAVTISWKLRTMAIEEFIPYITGELAERMGVALGTAISTGAGASATPREPGGIITALLAEGGTPQVVSYDPETADDLEYDDIVTAISKIHSSYLAGSAIYASNATIWTLLATLLDGVGRPLFVPDVTSGGVGRLFGMVVKPDAGVTAGSIIIGNPAKGYVVNTNEPMSIATEEHVKARETDYAAYSVVDGAVLDTKAFALIRNTP